MEAEQSLSGFLDEVKVRQTLWPDQERNQGDSA